MANTAINLNAQTSVLRVLAEPFVAFGNFLVRIGEASSRANQVQMLNNMSDAELTKIGLKREDIVRHVFADKFGL